MIWNKFHAKELMTLFYRSLHKVMHKHALKLFLNMFLREMLRIFRMIWCHSTNPSIRIIIRPLVFLPINFELKLLPKYRTPFLIPSAIMELVKAIFGAVWASLHMTRYRQEFHSHSDKKSHIYNPFPIHFTRYEISYFQ